jgi:hypothetical protein
VDRQANDATIKKAYRKIAKANHPDKNKDPAAQQKFADASAGASPPGQSGRRERCDPPAQSGSPASPLCALSRSSAYEVLMDSEVRPILKQAPTMVFCQLILKRRPARCPPPHRNARSTTTTARTDSSSVRTTAGTTRATSSRVSSAVEVRRLRFRARDLARR